MDNDNWNSVFLEEIMNDQEEGDSDDESQDDGAEQEVLPSIKSYKEAVVALENVALFCSRKGILKKL